MSELTLRLDLLCSNNSIVARDLFHQVVKDALIKDGWEITHDPFPVDYGDVQMQIDLGAERLLAATKDAETIAIEIKSFVKPSSISEFHTAVGQYLNYRRALRRSFKKY